MSPKNHQTTSSWGKCSVSEGIKTLPWVLSVPQDSSGNQEGYKDPRTGKKQEFSGGKVASGMSASHEAQRTAWRRTKCGNKAFGMLMPPKKPGTSHLEPEPCERTLLHLSFFHLISPRKVQGIENPALATKKALSATKVPPRRVFGDRKGSKHQILRSFRARTVLKFFWPLAQSNRKHLKSVGTSQIMNRNNSIPIT